MTDNAAFKQAIRRRMQETGEKYTEARRALLTTASSGEKYPWFYPAYWEDVCARFEQLAASEGDAVARAHVYFELHSLQLLVTLTPFRRIAIGRAPNGPDRWLSQRPEAERSTAIIKASAPLAAVGFGPELERNAQIVARVLGIIDERSRGASEQAHEAAEGRRAAITVPATRRPDSSTTEDPPPWGHRSQELSHAEETYERDFFLQHPKDTWLRSCREGIEDAELLRLVDAWIEDIERNYQDLVDGIPAAWPDHAEFDFQAVAEGLREEDGHGSNNDGRQGLPSPARVRVISVTTGEIGDQETVATDLIRLPPPYISPQPDGITIRPGEHWHIRGHRLSDGTIMPCRGTYRLAGAPAIAPARFVMG